MYDSPWCIAGLHLSLVSAHIIIIIIIIIIINYIIIIIIMRHQLGLNRPVSASSNGPFKGLPSRLRPYGLYRMSLSLEAPNYCLCKQSNNAGFSFVNSGKQVHLKHARRRFERNLVKDVHHRSVASRSWLKS